MFRVNGIIIRCVSIIILICLCAGSVMYVDGFFEFTFIDRSEPHAVTTPGSTPSTTDSYITSLLTSTTAGDSITSITLPESSTQTSGNGSSDNVSSPSSERFSPTSVDVLLADGYSITYNRYSTETVLAEVTLPEKFSAFTSGKVLYRESTLMPLFSDETFRYTELKQTKKDGFTLETYMGYILISSEKVTSVYDFAGELLFLSPVRLSPAYTRDLLDRPLYFTDNTKDFYYIDFEQKLIMKSEYNDATDGRGLYFNYNPSFGKSDNSYSVFSQYSEYSMTFKIDLSSDWKKANVSHLIAKELYLMYPNYANLVGKANKRFLEALRLAKKEIAAEKEEAKKTEGLTTTVSPEITSSPEVTSSPSVSDGITTNSTVTVSPPEVSASPVEINTPETTLSPESSSSPETTASPESSDSVITSSPEETSEPAETTSKYPSSALEGSDTIVKVFEGYRFGFGKTPEKLSYAYKAARAYNFSGGRAAIVDDYRRLTFLNTSFKTAISGNKTFFQAIEGANAGLYYIRNYFEPLYNDERGLGHLYFDGSYVMVRLVEVQKMKIKIIGRDENVLINKSGTIILPPEGYNLVTCTEGIMVLERNGRYGYYNPAAQTWIAQPIYTHIEPFYEGIGVIGIEGGVMGAIDKNGTVVIPFNYSYISNMSTGLISVYSADYGWQVFAKLIKTSTPAQ